MSKTPCFYATRLIFAENTGIVYPDASKNCAHNYLDIYSGTDRAAKQVNVQEHHHRTVTQIQRAEHKTIKWFIATVHFFPVLGRTQNLFQRTHHSGNL